MKIKLDDNSYIEVSLEKDDRVSLSIFAYKNKNSSVLVTTKLDADSLDDLITELVSLTPRVR